MTIVECKNKGIVVIRKKKSTILPTFVGNFRGLPFPGISAPRLDYRRNKMTKALFSDKPAAD